MTRGRKKGSKQSEATKEKIRLSRIGKPSPRKNVKLTQEIKDKISRSNIGISRNGGIPKSEEHKHKIGNSLKIYYETHEPVDNPRDEKGRYTKI